MASPEMRGRPFSEEVRVHRRPSKDLSAAPRRAPELPPIGPRSGARPPPQVPDQQVSDVVLAELVKALRELAGGHPPDSIFLEKLGARGDALAAGCATLVQFLDRRLQAGADPAAGNGHAEAALDAQTQMIQERQQLAAQIAFMERKVVKLKEKLKRPVEPSPAAMTMDLDDEGLTREQLVSKVGNLRAETSRLAAEAAAAASGGSPGSPTDLAALRTRITEAEKRVAQLRKEREAAEAQEAMARRVAANVAARLREVEQVREAEQSRLGGAHRGLQEELDLQALEIERLEQQRRAEVEGLRQLLAQRELELAGGAGAVEGGGGGADAEGAAHALDGEEASGALAVVEDHGEGHGDELARNEQMEERLAEIRARMHAAQAALKAVHDADEVAEARHKDMLHQIVHSSEAKALEAKKRSEAAARAAELEVESLLAEQRDVTAHHEELVRQIRAETEARAQELQCKLEALSEEMRQAMEDTKQTKRQKDAFRGSAWFVVRRGVYDPEAFVSALDAVLEAEAPKGNIHVIDSDAVDLPPPARPPGARTSYLPSAGAKDASPKVMAAIEDLTSEIQRVPSPLTNQGSEIPLVRKRGVKRGGRRSGVGGGQDAEEEPEDSDFPGWRPRAKQDGDQSAQNIMSPAAAAAAAPAPGSALALVPASPQVQEAPQDPRDPELRRVFFEVSQAAAASAPFDAERLLSLISAGDQRFEGLGVVSAAVLLGDAEPSPDWPEESFVLVERRVREVRGWPLVVTACFNTQHFVLKLVGFDGESGHELTLHLNEEDLNAVVPGAFALQPPDLVEAVLPSLRVLERDGHVFLAAVQEIRAPPNFANRLDPLLSDQIQLSAKWRKEERRRMREKEAPRSAQQMGPRALAVPSAASQAPPSAADSWERVREEVLVFRERFVLLSVERAPPGGPLRVTLQEAGRCSPFQVELPRNGFERQQRFHAEMCQLPGLALQLLAEEFVAPPMLVIRLATASLDTGDRVAAAESAFLALSTEDWTPAPPAVLATVASQRRTQLLHFLLQMPATARAAVEGPGALALASQGLPCGDGRRVVAQRGDGLVATAELPTPGEAPERRPGAPSSAWRPVCQRGRRVGERLVVLRVARRSDPFERLLVSAFETGGCGEWELLLSLDDARAFVGASLDGPLDDAGCAALLAACAFEHVGGRDVLTLRRPRGQPAQVTLLSLSETPADVATEELLALPAPSQTLALEYRGQDEVADDSLQDEDANLVFRRSLYAHLLEPPEDVKANLVFRRAIYKHILGPVEEDEAPEARPATSQSQGQSQALALPAAPAQQVRPSTALTKACLQFVGAYGAVPPGLRLTGGRFVDLREEGSTGARGRISLYCAARRVGSLDLVLSLEQLPESRGGHVLSIYHPATCTLFELALATRSGACPEKFLVERTVIAGTPVLLILSETAFPHAVHVLVREVGRGRELRFSVRDDEIYTVLPRRERHLMGRLSEGLVADGVLGLGEMQVPEDRKCGQLGDVEAGVVPVLRVPMLGKALLVCSAAFVLGGWRLKVSLTKADGAARFTLGVAQASGSGAHTVHLCDRGLTREVGEDRREPLALYGEVCEVDGAALFIATFLDAAPRALRVAVLDLASQEVFQILVLDAGADMALGAFEREASDARDQLLAAYSSFFPAAPTTETHGGDADGGGPSRLMYRTTRSLPSGQPYLLSVVRENVPDGSQLRLRVLMYHPTTAREVSVAVGDALLDKVLSACGLGDSRSTTASALDEARKQVAEQLLPFIYVNPDGSEMGIKNEALSPRPNH